jgi:hypothetical protein
MVAQEAAKLAAGVVRSADEKLAILSNREKAALGGCGDSACAGLRIRRDRVEHRERPSPD